jgi:hypothetical protein
MLGYDRRSVGQSVLMSSTHLGPQDQIFINVRQLRVCWCRAPSLTRGRVCRLQLLLVLASAVILGSECRETQDHILLSQIQDSRNGQQVFTWLDWTVTMYYSIIYMMMMSRKRLCDCFCLNTSTFHLTSYKATCSYERSAAFEFNAQRTRSGCVLM